jgi:hypothetical protein
MTDTNIGGHDRAKFGMYRNTLNGTYERSCCGSGNPLLSDRRSEVKPELLITVRAMHVSRTGHARNTHWRLCTDEHQNMGRAFEF